MRIIKAGLPEENMKIASIFKRVFKKGGWGKQMADRICEEVISPLTNIYMNLARITMRYRKNRDLRVSEVLPLLEKVEKNVFRIKEAVNTLAHLMYTSGK